MMDRPFETRMAEIDVSLRNLGAELESLGTALVTIERCTVAATSKFHAVQARRQELMADFAQLRADVQRTS